MIETDVLAEYLIHGEGQTKPSLLRQALAGAFCYTTMLNAMELFRAARTEQDQQAITRMLYVVRVLGYHARYAPAFAVFANEICQSTGLDVSDREAMVLGLARASKLTILTRSRYERYCAMKVVPVVRDVH